ncbi:MAG: glycosyl transferase family 2, partial [Thermoguttaceae bacterium]|nr:glycosyl transferase family 2 [Thermoguttaceae bacterium]
TGPIFVIAGDSPMLRGDSVKALFDEYDRRQKAGQPASAVLGTVSKENPFGMGRILRDAEGNFLGIVEERDATPEQRAITEINMSYYVFDAVDLFRALDRVTTDNAQGEYYITDVPAILRGEGKRVEALRVLSPEECLGVNTTEDAARVEEELLKRPHG